MKKKKIANNTVLVSSADTYYDDCPTCQAMKRAEEEGRSLTESEILSAFEKSKAAGGIVGIPPSEEKKKVH